MAKTGTAKTPESRTKTKKKLLTKKEKHKVLSKAQQAGIAKREAALSKAIKEGKPNLPVKRRFKRGGIYYHRVSPTDYEKQERLVFVAALVRKGKSNQQIVNFLMKKYKLSKPSSCKYLKRVYEEFQLRYTENDRAVLMYEHLEALNEGATIALRNGQLMAYEKLRRQYAECMGLLLPPTVIPSGHNQAVQVNINQEKDNRDPESSRMDLDVLEKLSGHDLYERLIEARTDSEAGLPESGSEVGVGSGEAAGVLRESLPDNDEG